MDDFDENVIAGQGGRPHLIAFLWDRYTHYLQRQIDEKQAAQQKTLTIVEATQKAPALHFVEWATDYLLRNRVVNVFTLDANVGLRFASQAEVALCPGIDVRGTMEDDPGVAVQVNPNRREPPPRFQGDRFSGIGV